MKKFTNNQKIQAGILFGIILIFVIIQFAIFHGFMSEEPVQITLNEFIKLIEEKKVAKVQYNPNNEYITVCLYNDDTKDMTIEQLLEYQWDTEDKRQAPYTADENFRKDILSEDIVLELVSADNASVDIIVRLLSMLLPLGLYIWLFSRINGVGNKNVSEKELIQHSDVKFSDVIGHDEIIDDIKFITELIKNPSKGESVGAKVPNGILLTGKPGTGKTLIAKAIAGEAEVPFIYVNSSSLIELYVGVGAKRVRRIFEVAKKNAPCIIFVDEIDSIGTKRSNSGDGHSEKEQTINELLQQMDGFSGKDGIFIIAATNRPDKLDSALTRSGRFDRRIDVSPPRDWHVRRELFEFYLNKFKYSDDIDMDVVSKQLVGFTGADIAMICNEASLIALMSDKSEIDSACIDEAIDKKIFHGNRSKREQHINDKRIVAYHEAGHATMHWLLGMPVARATIIGTTSGVGGAVFGEDLESQFRTSEYYENQVMVCYAGRASEEIKFGVVTQGASSDITQATDILDDYIYKLGFDSSFGLLDLEFVAEHKFIDTSAIFPLLQNKSKQLYSKTLELLQANYNKVELVAQKLLDNETLSGDEISKLLSGDTNGKEV